MRKPHEINHLLDMTEEELSRYSDEELEQIAYKTRVQLPIPSRVVERTSKAVNNTLK